MCIKVLYGVKIIGLFFMFRIEKVEYMLFL